MGNSAVRIPASVLEAAHVGLEQEVDVREETGRIIIEPVRIRPRYTLDELVAQCDTKKRRSREEQECNPFRRQPERLRSLRERPTRR